MMSYPWVQALGRREGGGSWLGDCAEDTRGKVLQLDSQGVEEWQGKQGKRGRYEDTEGKMDERPKRVIFSHSRIEKYWKKMSLNSTSYKNTTMRLSNLLVHPLQ